MTRLLLPGSSRADRLVVRPWDAGSPFEIRGFGGDDTLIGGDGADLLSGDEGDDRLRGGAGRDSLSGGDGRDDLDGGSGDDTIDGGADDDTLAGGSGRDLLLGGAGRDTLGGGDGQDSLSGGADGDRLDGQDGEDLLAGDSGRDTLDGGDGDDTLTGGEEEDSLRGGDGDDLLAGDAGDDLLAGGAGHDRLSGGAGEDAALFRGRSADYAITVLGEGVLRVEGLRGSARQDGSDTVEGVEWLRFADATLSADTTPPAVAILGLVEDTGTPGDGLTADRTPTITGTATPGARVELFRDGVAIGQAQAGADGGWAVTDAAGGAGLADGAYTYTARVTGRFGQVAEGAAPLQVAIDATAPAAPTLRLVSSSDTGAAGDGVTALGFVDLAGTAEAGATLRVAGSDTSLVVGADGTFLLKDVALAPGANAVTLLVTDAAGNLATGTFEVVRDAVAVDDPVLAWNHMALEAIRTAGSVTAYATRVLALESAAVQDAIAAIEGTRTLMVALDAPEGAPAGAAAAAAAHRILATVYGAQSATFDARLALDLARYEAGGARDAAVEFGRSVADAILAMRAGDGWDATAAFPGGTDPGEWRPTPPAFQPAHLPHWGGVQTWAIDSGDQFRPAGPPALDSAQYAADFEEVKRLGAIDSTERTADQTEIARYWRDQAGSYTPAGRWAQIAEEVLADLGTSTATNAWVMGVLNMIQADGAIAAWDAKYTFGSWRPITAIQLADTDGNPLTVADPGWRPLLTTPNHPDYLSGHATCSAASAFVLTYMLGEVAFENESVGLPGVTRSFDNFVDAALEAGKSRIYAGIHFDFANRDGIATGEKVAEYGYARLTAETDSFDPVLLLAGAPGGALAAPPVLSGLAFDNRAGLDAVQVRLNGGAARDVAVDGLGRFALDLAGLFGPLADGAHEVVVTAWDAAGNAAAPVAFAFTLDDPFG
ncbi:Ig-like domain-containing protein [Falsiroseomonas sp. CW058]|uniref:Ig-like domain-containing protein n=1 Tax=Falsiroseomonas sp. CW058 TaxID=3388664 RepID=UPI003D32448F